MRESRYVKVARIAYSICKTTLPTYPHPKSPHIFTFPQLAACVLVMVYLKLSYRDMEEWLLATDQVRETLELSRVPNYSTLQRTFQKLQKKRLSGLQRTLLTALEVEETLIAVDGTGYRDTQASAYYQSRQGKSYRSWVQGGYAVGCESQFILAVRDGPGPDNDGAFLPGLRRDARRYRCRKGSLLLGDRGFDGVHVQEGDLIPPIRRGGNLVAPERIERQEQVLAARLDGIYGQRWKCETVNSVIKRKLGDTIRSKKKSLKRREPALKALVYNLHR
jgi:hypothetical protein